MSIERKITALMTGLHAKIYKGSGGKVAGAMKGVEIVVITTTGRTSGKKRDRPVMKVTHDGHAHVIASNNGGDEHPSWFLNLSANPEIHVQDGADGYDATAVILTGKERDAVYESAKGQMDNFIGYEEKADRVIPVVRLQRH